MDLFPFAENILSVQYVTTNVLHNVAKCPVICDFYNGWYLMFTQYCEIPVLLAIKTFYITNLSCFLIITALLRKMVHVGVQQMFSHQHAGNWSFLPSTM